MPDGGVGSDDVVASAATWPNVKRTMTSDDDGPVALVRVQHRGIDLGGGGVGAARVAELMTQVNGWLKSSMAHRDWRDGARTLDANS